jgi:hypothetical protein
MRRRLVIERPIRRGDKQERREAKSKAQPEQSPKQRAQELVDSGMPYQMAMAVVHGKMELNEALERLSRRDRVNQLMERHELSRALATQVAIGHADLEKVMHRRRLQAHRETYRERTCLDAGAELTVARFGQDQCRLIIQTADAYALVGSLDGGEPAEIHKLTLKFTYAPTDWKKVRKAIKKDKRVAAEGLEPAKRPQDRYTCSDRRLFGYVDSGREVVATLLDGDILRGVVVWFSRYECCFRLKEDVEVTLFRHALHELKSV